MISLIFTLGDLRRHQQKKIPPGELPLPVGRGSTFRLEKGGVPLL